MSATASRAGRLEPGSHPVTLPALIVVDAAGHLRVTVEAVDVYGAVRDTLSDPSVPGPGTVVVDVVNRT